MPPTSLALHVCVSHPTVSYTNALRDSQADPTAVPATALHGTALGRASERVLGSALGHAALERAPGKAAESASGPAAIDSADLDRAPGSGPEAADPEAASEQ